HRPGEDRDALAGLRQEPVRPLLADDPGAWARLAGERTHLYEALADLTYLDARGEPAEEVAESLVAYVRGAFPPVSSVAVSLRRGYEVVIGPVFPPPLRLFLPDAGAGGTAFVVADPGVSALYLDAAVRADGEAGWQAVHLAIPDGEDAKTLAVAEALYRQLALREAQRDDLVIALGGGA